LIFAAVSPRCIEIDVAKQIKAATAGTCPLVGVFLNSPLREISTIVKQIGLDLVQLHGSETPKFCAALPVPVIKVFSFDFAGNPDIGSVVAKYQGSCNFVMFDKPKGSSDPDWLERAIDSVSKVESTLPPYFFAGGLTPSNVLQVTRSIHPYCIDVSSGVESRIGYKDAKAMKEFCEAVTDTVAGAHQKGIGG